MGTNYFHHTNPCKSCGRYDIRHICKSRTMFRGYPDLTPAIRSWSDWKWYLRLLPGGIVDEYGEFYETEHFIHEVEKTDLEARRRQYDWVQEHGTSKTNDWLDPEGFSFHNGEFA